MKFIRQTGTTHNEFGDAPPRNIAGFVERDGECIAFCLDEAVRPEDEVLTADEYGERFAAITVPLTIESTVGFVEHALVEETKLNLDLKAGLKRAEGRVADLADLPVVARDVAGESLQMERDVATEREAKSSVRLERLAAEFAELVNTA